MNAEVAARRIALEHILALSAEVPFRDRLVLRGSMAMLAWAGSAAREPGDLDWVVRPDLRVPVDPRHPYPFLDRIDAVQHWPEAVHGAGRNVPWAFEEFDAGGQHPRLPPEGLRWVIEDDGIDRPHRDLVDLLREHPDAGGGVRFDQCDPDDIDLGGYGYVNGARLILWWDGPSGTGGEIQLDFAYDERLPEPAVALAVPRAAGGPPIAVWAAGPELSLVWKVQYIATDQVRWGRAKGKDLYDAVLLAERPGMRVPPRLARLLPDLAAIPGYRVDWIPFGPDRPAPGPLDQWLDRLATAMRRVAPGSG